MMSYSATNDPKLSEEYRTLNNINTDKENAENNKISEEKQQIPIDFSIEQSISTNNSFNEIEQVQETSSCENEHFPIKRRN